MTPTNIFKLFVFSIKSSISCWSKASTRGRLFSMLRVFHSSIFNSEQVMLIKYACFAIILEITSLQKRSNKRAFRFLLITVCDNFMCDHRRRHCMPSKISSPSPNLSEILADKEEAKQNSQVWGFLSPVDKRSNLFCTSGRSVQLCARSLLRPTCPRSISYPPERQSSSCPQPIIHHYVLWVWAQEGAMSSNPIYQPLEVVRQSSSW